MISVDTNILVFALDSRSERHRAARAFLEEQQHNPDFVLCEQVLVELYLHLRNPAVFEQVSTEKQAVEICQGFRHQARWRLVETAPVMEEVWGYAKQKGFARRRIIDARLALTLRHYGVQEFATANTKDFSGFGFRKVFEPRLGLADSP